MERLLSNAPKRSDGSCTWNSLAIEAEVSRATVFRFARTMKSWFAALPPSSDQAEKGISTNAELEEKLKELTTKNEKLSQKCHDLEAINQGFATLLAEYDLLISEQESLDSSKLAKLPRYKK